MSEEENKEVYVQLDNIYTYAREILIKLKNDGNESILQETHLVYLSNAIDYWNIIKSLKT